MTMTTTITLAETYSQDKIPDQKAAVRACEEQAIAMAQQFDRKKKAYELRHQTHRQTGSLDIGRLAYHKTSDELFKTLTHKPEGKSHGVYILLDFSGSMAGKIRGILKQAYSIVRFCEKARIDFKVVSFTTGNSGYTGKRNSFGENSSKNYTAENLNLCSLMSSKKTPDQNRKSFLVCMRFGQGKSINNIHPRLSLDGTPLEDSLIVCYADLQKMRRSLKIQNMNWVVLTDGYGMTYPSMAFNDSKYIRQNFYNNTTFIDPYNGNKEYKFLTKDKKGISYGSSNIFYANMMNVARESGIKTLGFFLGYTASPFMKRRAPFYERYDHKISQNDIFCQLSDFQGFDKYFFMKECNVPSLKNESRIMSRSIADTICENYSLDSKF